MGSSRIRGLYWYMTILWLVSGPLLLGTTAAAPTRCLYKTLGVSKDCSKQDLKKAYRKMCLQHHPDKGGSEAKFKEISEAYEILSDEEKRQHYDQFGTTDSSQGGSSFYQQQGFPQQGFSQNSFRSSDSSSSFSFSMNGMPSFRDSMNLEEVLMELFGMPHSKRSSNTRSSREYTRQLACSLEDLAKGATKKLKVRWKDGSSRVYTIHLKKGWKEGTKIKFPPKGGFPAMTFVVHETKHAMFQRRGDDLIYYIPFKKKKKKSQSVRLTLPNGQTFERNIRMGPGQPREVIVPGKGMPIKGGPQCGDLILRCPTTAR